MSLQDIFYLVSIIAMSLLTILFVTLIIVMIYIRIKIGELVSVTETRLNELKELVTHPGRIASAVGGAMVDTAVEQVARMTDGRQRRKKK